MKVFTVGSDGVVATEANATGNGTISDGSGKLKDISISGLPTNQECNFMATELYKVDGNTTVDMNRSSIAPCPKKDEPVELGLNSLSSNQMTALKELGEDIGSDDPITYAFGLLVTRIGDLNSTDLQTVAEMAKQAVSAEGNSTSSFTNILKSQLEARGKSESEIETTLDNFRSYILHNSSTETVDGNSTELNLGGFTKLYKDAVDSSSSSDSNASMGKAGGMMGKIFIEAGNDAGIPVGDIVYGLSSSGDVVVS